MEPEVAINPVKIDFSEKTYSRLKSYVTATGLLLEYFEPHNTVSLKVINSRHTVSEGVIRVPINDLPKLINELTEIQNQLVATGKLQ